MPKLFMVSGYSVYFWSDENNEPIHVHVAKGKPTPNATKIWPTKSGGCILASNGSKISNKELNEFNEIFFDGDLPYGKLGEQKQWKI